MGIKLYREPKLEKPIMFVSWPGIGNIGIIAVNTLKGILKARGTWRNRKLGFLLSEEGFNQRWLVGRFRVSE